ncbi:ankyrin repeat protein SKIP35-like isoform X2 [Phoenix dactylifera]|uniref:Ankyrin repeat protein SKIP35-like isoform X2 n=2 Tax=Phoenix dactylifera TaxID=42345 RepID=A0A8B7MTM9_PHODC|nr:ankyrin repeat protein SKIP35-like isoform X2 [Phoenix dactylifera]
MFLFCKAQGAWKGSAMEAIKHASGAIAGVEQVSTIWFLYTQQDLAKATQLIKRIVSNGAHDFTKVTCQTSFLASCVLATLNCMMNFSDTKTGMIERVKEHLQAYEGAVPMKAKWSVNLEKFISWAFYLIEFHRRNQGNRDKDIQSIFETQLQLSAFKTFLNIARENIMGQNFGLAFDAACFSLSLLSNSVNHGWSSGVARDAVLELLGFLVEGSVEIVNQCFMKAARFGSTELVSILLQIAQARGLHVNVNFALFAASEYSHINTMECLVTEGHATYFFGPLMTAARSGCMPVVQWFVKRGCTEMELCYALTAATSNNQVAIISYLLQCIPQQMLNLFSFEILKSVGEERPDSFEGVNFLLSSDFLRDPIATYAFANRLATSNEEAITPELKVFLLEHWSAEAFVEGMRAGEVHYVNLMRILRRGKSEICLRELPPPLVIVIAYLPLYRECLASSGSLLPQRLRGELMVAARRLSNWAVDEMSEKRELLEILQQHMPCF